MAQSKERAAGPADGAVRHAAVTVPYNAITLLFLTS